MGKVCDCTRTPWHTPATSKVCKISHVLFASKWQVVVPGSAGFYDEFNVHCLLFAPNLIRNDCAWDIAFKLAFQRSHATIRLDSCTCKIASIPNIIFSRKPVEVSAPLTLTPKYLPLVHRCDKETNEQTDCRRQLQGSSFCWNLSWTLS